MLCPRQRASQSMLTSVKAVVCVIVAMFFQSFMLVISSGFFISFNFLTLGKTQSQPCRCSTDPFEALANWYLLDLGIDGGLSLSSSFTAAIVSGVQIIGIALLASQ